MKKGNVTKILVESALMVALATVLSLVKLADMPYGGSITLASMLPVMIIAYRHGTSRGLAAGLVFAVIQQLLGLNNLSYFTTWQSILAVMLLDYVAAFTVVGLGAIFKGKLVSQGYSIARRQSLELGMGAIFVSVLRYLLHTVAGCTVWAGLSIPTEAALIYSLAYNATYMIPEGIILTAVSVWLGGMIDFTRPVPKRLHADHDTPYTVLDYVPHISALLALVAVVADTALIFPYLQDAESGEFTLRQLGSVSWLAVGIISGICALLVIALFTVRAVVTRRADVKGGKEE